MFISDYAIKRPLLTVVAMLTLVAFGAVSYLMLQTDEFPEVQPPVVLTTVIYPGASPDQVEREILDPMEEAIQGIEGVDKIQSAARDGFAQITTFFVFSKDLQQATQDIRDAVSAKRQDLPAEMEEPVYRRFSPTDRPIVTLAIYSDVLTPAQLTRIADPGITRELRSVSGVANVQVSGSVEREMTVELDPKRLQAAGVTVPEVVAALQSQNLAVPVGRIGGSLDERTIRLKGRLEGTEDFELMVVGQRQGRLIRLGDVATVRDGTEEARTLALYNGSDAVGIEITKTSGYSTTDVAGKLIAKVDQLLPTLPAGVQIKVVKNSGIRVSDSVTNVQKTLMEGAALTVLVVFLFLNSWRSTVITGLALPVSVLASFIAVWVFGFTLNTMSLLGLSLAIGILIDDAIVVRENIVRHVEMGKDHYTAAREGTAEIGMAVTATTLAIVAVFVPIAFLNGEAGQWFKPLALTIACSVLVSLFVSFSLDPMLSAYWPDPHVPEEKKWFITRMLDRFNNWFNGLANRYRGVIAWALDHPKTMVLLAVSTFVIALALPATGLVGGAFFPGDDRSELNMAVETPPGANMDYMRLKMAEALSIAVETQPEIEYTFASVGDGSGSVDKGSVYFKLTPKHTRDRSAEEIGYALRDEIRRMAGADVSVFTDDFAGAEKAIQLQLRGQSIEVLEPVAEQYLAALRTVRGAVDIGLSTRGQKPELDIIVDRGLAGSLGLTVGAVAQSLRPAFAGIDVGTWVDPSGETRDVTIRLSDEARSRAADLEQIPISVAGPGGSAQLIPLGQVASVQQSLGPAIINHLDRDAVIRVEANTAGRPLSEVMADIAAATANIPLPPGVTYSEGGQAEQQAEVFTSIFVALGIAIGLMYLVLVVQFSSFLDPLAILVSLPLSLIGVMGALAITGSTINIMSMIGVILLAGIVAKNAILLIDFAKTAREQHGMPLREALIEAGAIRLRPILMTTFALVAGMMPIALGTGEGAAFRSPLGIAVIGGVITSTVLTLVVVPTVYEILDAIRGRLLRTVGLKPPQTGEHRTYGMGEPVPSIGD